MGSRVSRWLADRWVMGVALLVLGYLSLPIAVVAALSFNRPSSRLSYDFNEFTLDNWRQPCATSNMCDAVVRSVQIGSSPPQSPPPRHSDGVRPGPARFRGRPGSTC
jgi:spermidine/putrescine transport system permease protein